MQGGGIPAGRQEHQAQGQDEVALGRHSPAGPQGGEESGDKQKRSGPALNRIFKPVVMGMQRQGKGGRAWRGYFSGRQGIGTLEMTESVALEGVPAKEQQSCPPEEEASPGRIEIFPHEKGRRDGSNQKQQEAGPEHRPCPCLCGGWRKAQMPQCQAQHQEQVLGAVGAEWGQGQIFILDSSSSTFVCKTFSSLSCSSRSRNLFRP